MNTKQRELKNQGQKMVANAYANKGKKRLFNRKEQREVKKINQTFDAFCNKFVEVLLGIPFDDKTAVFDIDGAKVKADDLDVFTDYNLQWVKYCAWYNAQKKHIVECNENAFHEWAIDNTKTNSNDIPFNFGSNKLVDL